MPLRDDGDPSTGEIKRHLHYLEKKVDDDHREIHGVGRDLGLRGMMVKLEGQVRELDEDLGAQRKELMEAITKLGEESDKKLRTVSTEILAKLDQRRLPVWANWILFLCAVVVAGAVGYNALQGQ